MPSYTKLTSRERDSHVGQVGDRQAQVQWLDQSPGMRLFLAEMFPSCDNVSRKISQLKSNIIAFQRFTVYSCYQVAFC